MKRRVWISAALALAFLVFVGFIFSKPAQDPIAVRVVGQTNDLNGNTWNVFQVTNIADQSWII